MDKFINKLCKQISKLTISHWVPDRDYFELPLPIDMHPVFEKIVSDSVTEEDFEEFDNLTDLIENNPVIMDTILQQVISVFPAIGDTPEILLSQFEDRALLSKSKKKTIKISGVRIDHCPDMNVTVTEFTQSEITKNIKNINNIQNQENIVLIININKE